METMKFRIKRMVLAAFLVTVLAVGNVEAKGLKMHRASSLENVKEAKVHLEEWMVSDRYWHRNDVGYAMVAERDEVLALAPWMLDVAGWNRLVPVEVLMTEIEVPVALADWMLDVRGWIQSTDMKDMVFVGEYRQGLEAWMVDQQFWN